MRQFVRHGSTIKSSVETDAGLGGLVRTPTSSQTSAIGARKHEPAARSTFHGAARRPYAIQNVRVPNRPISSEQ